MKKGKSETRLPEIGGDGGIRTLDLTDANRTLYHAGRIRSKDGNTLEKKGKRWSGFSRFCIQKEVAFFSISVRGGVFHAPNHRGTSVELNEVCCKRESNMVLFFMPIYLIWEK